MTDNYQLSYSDKLKDPRWKLKRQLVLYRDGFKCRLCDSKNNLEVHHKQYVFLKTLEAFIEPWQYHHKALITVCSACHKQGHQLYKVPIIYI